MDGPVQRGLSALLKLGFGPLKVTGSVWCRDDLAQATEDALPIGQRYLIVLLPEDGNYLLKTEFLTPVISGRLH